MVRAKEIRRRQWLLPLLVTACILCSGACGGEVVERGIAGYFDWCGADTDCGEGSCVCGICTQGCQADATACDAGPSESQCFVSSQRPHQWLCAGRQATGLCLTACSSDQDCTVQWQCLEGACVPGQSPVLVPSGSESESEFSESQQPIDSVVAVASSESLCSEQLAVSGAVFVWKQGHLESLRGCEIIEGDLLIAPFEGVDFSPLSELRIVRGQLALASYRAAIEAEQAFEYSADAPSSLAGLEGLEQVGGLSLFQGSLENFDSLRNLHTIGPRIDGVFDAGRLNLGFVPSLRSLAGMVSLQTVHSISILGAPLLEQLPAPTGGEPLYNLFLQEVDSLTSLGALRLAPDMGEFAATGTFLVDLAAVADVQRIGELRLSGFNSFDAFSSLREVGRLSIYRSGAKTLAPLDTLESLEQLFLSSMSLLEEPPRFANVIAGPGGLSVSVSDNPLLQGLPEFPGVSVFDELTVIDNAALQTLQVPGLLQAKVIEIARNPQLSSVSFPQLENIQWALRVVANLQLPESQLEAFEDLNVPFIKWAGNQDQAIGLSPCPWILDRVCDERFVELCAEGTDVKDCE